MLRAWALIAVLVASAPAARADDNDPPPGMTPAQAPPPAPAPTGAPVGTQPDGGGYHPILVSPAKPVVIKEPNERTWGNIATCAGIAAVGFALGGVGLYYNLDSRNAANTVSSPGATGLAWSAALQADVDRAHDSGVKAGVFYGIGGAAVIAAVVTLIATDPGSHTTTIYPHDGTALIAPAPGGAVVGGAWSF